MYMDDLEAPRSIEYTIQPLGQQPMQAMASSIQQRSTSRTSIYSTSSSDQENGGAGVMLSTLEPVAKNRQQSLGEIEMISTMNNGVKSNENNQSSQ